MNYLNKACVDYIEEKIGEYFETYDPSDVSACVDYIEEKIGEYFETYDPSDVSIGIFNAQVSLSNLSLKPHSFDFGYGNAIRIEYGHVGCASLQLPWLQLHTGRIEGSISNVALEVRLLTSSGVGSVPSSTSGTESFLHRIKMDKLAHKERKMLGYTTDGGGGKSSWTSAYFQSVIAALLLRIFRACLLRVTNVTVMLTIPLEGSREVRMTMVIDELLLSEGAVGVGVGGNGTGTDNNKDRRSQPSSPLSSLLSKNLRIESVSIAVDAVPQERLGLGQGQGFGVSGSRISKERDRTTRVLPRPFMKIGGSFLSLIIGLGSSSSSGSSRESGDGEGGGGDGATTHESSIVETVKAHMSLQSLEIMPCACQIETLLEVTQSISHRIQSHRDRFMMRPPRGQLFHAKDWWKYTLYSLLMELNPGYVKGFRTVSEEIRRKRKLRNRYLVLFRKYMEAKLVLL
eukprot:gene11084-23177_t